MRVFGVFVCYVWFRGDGAYMVSSVSQQVVV